MKRIMHIVLRLTRNIYNSTKFSLITLRNYRTLLFISFKIWKARDSDIRPRGGKRRERQELTMVNVILKCRREALHLLLINDEVYVKSSATTASLRFRPPPGWT
jgi:hypothetical protein